MTLKQEKLVIDNTKMVTHIIMNKTKFMLNKMSFEELQSIGNVGLVQAAIRFDESKGFAFSTFAYSTIIGEMYTAYRKQIVGGGLKVSREMLENYFRSDDSQLHSELPDVFSTEQLTADGTDITVSIPYIVDFYENIGYVELIKRIEECIEEEFSGKSKDAIQVFIYEFVYMGVSITQADIAKVTGVSQAHVARILKQFREELTKRGVTVEGAHRRWKTRPKDMSI